MNTNTLLIAPTRFEAELLKPRLALRAKNANPADVVIHECGFGPAIAGVVTSQLLVAQQPKRVILTGIAGTLSDRLIVGSAAWFSRVAIYGIGAGSGPTFQTAQELGWPQLDDSSRTDSANDVVTLASSVDRNNHLLVTCCAASGSSDEAQWRRQKFPDGMAEDMEAFSVVVACQRAGVPVEVVRGISNVAGDRDKANWQIERAIDAVATELVGRLT